MPQPQPRYRGALGQRVPEDNSFARHSRSRSRSHRPSAVPADAPIARLHSVVPCDPVHAVRERCQRRQYDITRAV